MSLKSKVEKIPGYNSLVRPLHWVQAVQAGMKYQWPAKNLKVIGVTGTNGKTTTCFMIWKMLNESGRRAGLLTTVGWSEDGEHMHQQFEHMTTERVEVLDERIRAVAEAGAEYLVLEVTSHALMQYRTLGIPIEIAVFTNITHEHLDYHGTFENYRKAKMKLFKQAKYGVVNMDDPNARYFVNEYSSGDVITYGINGGDYRATDIELTTTGVQYSCIDLSSSRSTLLKPATAPSQDAKSSSARCSASLSSSSKNTASKLALRIKTQIPGRFNVYNSLAAVCVGKKLGLQDEEIERGIAALTEVEGRMNRIREGQEFEVIVDYAHTPDALEKVFESVAPSPSQQISSGHDVTSARRCGGRASSSSVVTSGDSGTDCSDGNERAPKKTSSKPLDVHNPNKYGDCKVIAVHGGAGRRDESTREMRGEILGKYSDIVIITEDDSRDEEPAKIAEQFMVGAEKAGKVREKDLYLELDREKAIRRAIRMARKGDLVLILGKGHEKTILRADGPHEFEDIKVAQKVLRELKK